MSLCVASIYVTLPITDLPCPACARPIWRVELRQYGVYAGCPGCGRELAATPGPPTSALSRALAAYGTALVDRLQALDAAPDVLAWARATREVAPPLLAALCLTEDVLTWVARRAGTPAARAEAAHLHRQLAAHVGPVLALPPSIAQARGRAPEGDLP